MAGRGTGPEFVEALARGLDVIQCFDDETPAPSLSEIARMTGLARPTARRLLLTLEELGFVRSSKGQFRLTPQTLRLGMAYLSSLNAWEVARPHMEALVRQTNESSSMSQLDGSDIVYVARVAVPKIITLRVNIGTRFPAPFTSQGKVLLAALDSDELAACLAVPSTSDVAHRPINLVEFGEELRTVRAQGWAVADEQLAPGIRSVAVPVRGGDGAVRAAMNVTVHASETTLATLLDEHLPRLLHAASAVSADWALADSVPQADVV